MFKALILSLALATGLQADVKNTTPVEILNGGLPGTPSGALTYALNQALTGTSSSAIDLSGTVGLWLTLTSTASANVLAYFSNGNLTYTTGASQMYILQSPGSYPIPQKARYVSFYNGATVPTTRVSAFYYSVVAPAVSVASGGSVNAFITGTVATNDAAAYGYLTTTAYGTAGRGGSFTAVNLTSAYSMNITVAAGVNGPCIVTIYPANGPNTFLWNTGPSWLAPNTPIILSSTAAIQFTAGIGDFLNMSVTAAALTCTPQVRYAPIY